MRLQYDENCLWVWLCDDHGAQRVAQEVARKSTEGSV